MLQAPGECGRRNRYDATIFAILAVRCIGAAGLLGAALFGCGIDETVVVPSISVRAMYLLGAAAAVRLFTGRPRALAWVAIALLLITVPFAGWHLLARVAIACVVAIAGRSIADRRVQRRVDDWYDETFCTAC